MPCENRPSRAEVQQIHLTLDTYYAEERRHRNLVRSLAWILMGLVIGAVAATYYAWLFMNQDAEIQKLVP